MVFFNYATMQMAAKIVYYGPGLCGKTTNLHHIYSKTSPQSRGEMVSLETETDRTLFFDLLPIDVGVIGGFKTRLQLYTVPGQVFYNTTRKLVLKGVDGIVFVADSQRPMLEANVESLKNLRENLAEIGTDLDEIPLVLQLNKRDLPNIATVEMMLDALDPERRAEHVESVASIGTGVFETLKTISKLTLRGLRRRMTGEEPTARLPSSSRSSAQFRVQDNSRTMAGATPTPPVKRPDTAPIPAMKAAPEPQQQPQQTYAVAEAEAPAVVELTAPVVDAFDADATVAAPQIDRRMIMDAPVPDVPMVDAAFAHAVPEPLPEPVIEPVPEAPIEIPDEVSEALPEETPEEVLQELPPAIPEELSAIVEEVPEPVFEPIVESIIEEPEEELAIPIAAAPVAEELPEPEVKTVKVRSNVDIMAELEALRKRATNTTPKAPRRDVLADLASLRPKRDINRTLHLKLPSGVLPRSKSVRVTLSFEDDAQGVIDIQIQHVELGDTSDVQSLSVNLKIDPA
jgi:signal recognition particle receptor subunit beta